METKKSSRGIDKAKVQELLKEGKSQEEVGNLLGRRKRQIYWIKSTVLRQIRKKGRNVKYLQYIKPYLSMFVTVLPK